MHSHILPGLDDGAADWDQALAMARVAVEDGIAEMVCTPHWVLGKYENDRETVLRRFAEFEERLAARGRRRRPGWSATPRGASSRANTSPSSTRSPCTRNGARNGGSGNRGKTLNFNHKWGLKN